MFLSVTTPGIAAAIESVSAEKDDCVKETPPLAGVERQAMRDRMIDKASEVTYCLAG